MFHCSGVPLEKIAELARPVPISDIAIPASPQNTSSFTIGSSSPDGSTNRFTLESSPYRPIFAASWITGHGVCSRSSHSGAAGRITFCAKSCAQSRISRWSSFRSSEKVFHSGFDRSAASSPASAITSADAAVRVVGSVMVMMISHG